jgi:hypothetical protein
VIAYKIEYIVFADFGSFCALFKLFLLIKMMTKTSAVRRAHYYLTGIDHHITITSTIINTSQISSIKTPTMKGAVAHERGS